ncbi:MAG: hypothetical protein ABIS39_07440 [Sphingomicrobium sp.]
MSKGSVTGWKLDRGERETLLRDHPPRYAEAVADHVTLEVGGEALPDDVRAAIVGRTDDGAGVEAMVVTIDGTADRPDGSTYHITWSLGPGRLAVESNDVIRERGLKSFADPIPVTLIPARF